MSIRLRIMLSIITAVIISIAGVTVMVSAQMNKAFINQFNVSSKAQLARMESFVNNFFENADNMLKVLRDSETVRRNLGELSTYLHTRERFKLNPSAFKGGEKAIFDEFNSIAKSFPSYDGVFIGNANGGFLLAPEDSLPGGYDPRTRNWYTEPMRTGKHVLTDAYVSATGMVVCTVGAAISADSGMKGAIGIDVGLDSLTREIGGVRVGATGYVMMLDSAGQVIIDPQNSSGGIPQEKRWLGKTLDKLAPDASKAMQTLKNLKSGIAEVEFNGKTWLAGVQSTGANWTLIMLQEKAEVFGAAMSVTLSILGVGLIILVLMCAMAWAVSRSIAGPVAVLASSAREVAGGNLEAIPADEAPFKGELGLLHKSLKSMVSELSSLIKMANSRMSEAENALAQARTSANEAESAKQQAEKARREGIIQAAGRISSIMHQLADATANLIKEAELTERRASEQRMRVSGTAAAIEEMSSSVANVADGTVRTAELAEKARGEAGGGRALVMDLVNRMRQIEKQSLAMRESLADLGAKAGDIGQIMGVINDIADQTNLLALNAAIEAARAGEAGRGFAVVADEVRKLAEKTMEATKQVGSAITSIQQGTDTNVRAMQEAAATIGGAAEMADKAGEALNSIEDVVKNTANEVNGIASASREQSKATEEINKSTTDISRLTDEVADSSHKSNEVAHELSKLSRQLNDIVSEMQR